MDRARDVGFGLRLAAAALCWPSLCRWRRRCRGCSRDPDCWPTIAAARHRCSSLAAWYADGPRLVPVGMAGVMLAAAAVRWLCSAIPPSQARRAPASGRW